MEAPRKVFGKRGSPEVTVSARETAADFESERLKYDRLRRNDLKMEELFTALEALEAHRVRDAVHYDKVRESQLHRLIAERYEQIK